MDNPFESLEIRLSNIENILQDLKGQSQAPKNQATLKTPVSIKRISDLTNLATQTIYGLASSRKIPHFKQGKKLYFFEDEIIEWIQKGKRKTENEIIDETMENTRKGFRS
jgi:hypothetical protein